MHTLAALILGVVLSIALPVVAQDFYPPINESLAGSLGVDVTSLESRLGIDRNAEKTWAAHRQKVCASFGLIPSKCSGEGKSLSDLKTLADTGDPIFQNSYAFKLEETLTTPEAAKESFYYFMAAASQGLPHAQVTVGWRLLHGQDVGRDPVAAFEWNLKAAHQGHPEGANNVGFQYQHGIGVGRSYDDALAWYTYAALRGSMVAYGSLLQMKRDHR